MFAVDEFICECTPFFQQKNSLIGLKHDQKKIYDLFCPCYKIELTSTFLLAIFDTNSWNMSSICVWIIILKMNSFGHLKLLGKHTARRVNDQAAKLLEQIWVFYSASATHQKVFDGRQSELRRWTVRLVRVQWLAFFVGVVHSLL